MRTGIGWLDAPAPLLFAVVTVLSLLRLFPARGAEPRHGGLPDFLDGGFHAVMGVAMVAMFWPGVGAGRVWVALLGSAAVWLILVLAQAIRAAPASRPARARWPLPRI